MRIGVASRGRWPGARNNDIVLRHASVSKFHAWFEYGEGGELLLGDARSTNRTMHNRELVARDLVRIESGDQLSFGDVVTRFCSVDIVRDALNDG